MQERVDRCLPSDMTLIHVLAHFLQPCTTTTTTTATCWAGENDVAVVADPHFVGWRPERLNPLISCLLAIELEQQRLLFETVDAQVVVTCLGDRCDTAVEARLDRGLDILKKRRQV